MHPNLLHRIFRFPNACGVGQEKLQIPQLNLFFHYIPGSAGNVGDDAALVAGKDIH